MVGELLEEEKLIIWNIADLLSSPSRVSMPQSIHSPSPASAIPESRTCLTWTRRSLDSNPEPSRMGQPHRVMLYCCAAARAHCPTLQYILGLLCTQFTQKANYHLEAVLPSRPRVARMHFCTALYCDRRAPSQRLDILEKSTLTFSGSVVSVSLSLFFLIARGHMYLSERKHPATVGILMPQSFLFLFLIWS